MELNYVLNYILKELIGPERGTVGMYVEIALLSGETGKSCSINLMFHGPSTIVDSTVLIGSKCKL
uniref:Uncharacterized protein n=1 Tax=Anguilla anguilla TaxID=7936 RepID=A0A0E9W0G4_ANGAN